MITLNQSLFIGMISLGLGVVSSMPAAAPMPAFATAFIATYLGLSAIASIGNMFNLFNQGPEQVIHVSAAPRAQRRVRFVEVPEVRTFGNTVSRTFTSSYDAVRRPFAAPKRVTPTGTPIPSNATGVKRTVTRNGRGASVDNVATASRPIRTTAAGTAIPDNARHVTREVNIQRSSTSNGRASQGQVSRGGLSNRVIVRQRP